MGSRFGVCLVLSVVLSPCVHAASGTDPNRMQPDSKAEFVFARGQWPLFIPVRFGPRTWDFMLDTGCTRTMFDLSFRPQLGRPKERRRTSGLGNPMVVQVFAAPRAFMGPFNLADCNEVACADLNGFAQITGRDVHGVLGMDVLRKHILQIDFDEGRIAFLDNEQGDPREWGLAFPITYSQMKMPQIRLAVGGQSEQDFVVDTGCETSGALAKDSFRLAVAKGRLKPVDTSMVAFAGVVKSGQVRIDHVAAGPFEYHGLIFTAAKGNLLGLGFLSRHVVTFDFPHDRLYLKRGKSFDKPDEAGMCGVSIVRSEGRTVVSEVYKNEPAAKSGIQVGDVILKLNGQDVNTYERWEIRDLLRSGHGKEITMTIQRGGEVKDVKVVLERQV
jgi:hypothetical protein